MRIRVHPAQQLQANRYWPRRVRKHRQYITSALPLIVNNLQLLNKPAQSRPATTARCVASAMAALVLNKPYRFILVSDLDWTMVSINVYRSAMSGSQVTRIARYMLPVATCQVSTCRLIMTTKRTHHCMPSTSFGSPSLLKTVCWCSQRGVPSNCTMSSG